MNRPNASSYLRSTRSLVLVSLLALPAAFVACDAEVDGVDEEQDGTALAGLSCEKLGTIVDCDDETSTTCVRAEAGLEWSACAVPECEPSQQQDCQNKYAAGTPEAVTLQGKQSCEQAEDGQWHFGSCIDGSSVTPLVLSFDGAPVSFGEAEGAFGLDPSRSVATDWPSARTPWLALDRDGNGSIDDGGELFGSATHLGTGGYATNGFEALAELDDNGDGLVDARDRKFDSLVVWTDRNQDRQSDPSELGSLRTEGVTSIAVGWHADARCDRRGNCEIETARLGLESSAAARIVDIHLRVR